MSRKVRLVIYKSSRSCVNASIIVRHRNVEKLKRKFKGSADDWETLLSHFLLQKQLEGDGAKLLENVRMVYTLKGENIEITIQQDVKGIKASQIRTPPDETSPPVSGLS